MTAILILIASSMIVTVPVVELLHITTLAKLAIIGAGALLAVFVGALCCVQKGCEE